MEGNMTRIRSLIHAFQDPPPHPYSLKKSKNNKNKKRVVGLCLLYGIQNVFFVCIVKSMLRFRSIIAISMMTYKSNAVLYKNIKTKPNSTLE